MNQPTPSTTPSSIAATVAMLQATFGNAPTVAVVLGSGWAGAAEQMQDAQRLSYADLAAFNAFSATQVQGHVSEIVVGHCGTQRVAMLRGRTHTY